MTNNDNISDRLDRIEAIVESNSCAIQSMLDQRASDRLKREEEKADHEQRMARLEEIQGDVARVQLSLTQLLASLNENRPTVLQKLNSVKNKVDEDNLNMTFANISDREWFEMNLNPERNKVPLGFSLASLPPEKIQRNFNGKAGRVNLQQAFSFYQYVRSNYLSSSNATIMDFGAGWGRIARFFCRDTTVENIWCVDPFSTAVNWMRKINLPCKIVHSKNLPPIPNINQTRFDLIYAHSVFSHLTEEYFRSWVVYLMSLLKDDGVLIFTTRGSSFIDHIEKNSIKPAVFQNYRELRQRYSNGEFLFFHDRGNSGELSGDFFGEAFIPRQYVESRAFS